MEPITYQCDQCGFVGPVDKALKKKKDALISFPLLDSCVNSAASLPILCEVTHSGFWITNVNGKHVTTIDKNCDRNSVMLIPNCLLYIYKLALRHLLLTMKVITPTDIDNANLVPHIMVRKNKTDTFSKYDLIQGAKYVIEEKDLSARSDFLTIELDMSKDLHCTMIYSKHIKQRVDLVEAFKIVVKILNTYPELIEKYRCLPYFGEAHIGYWYNNPRNYPFNVEMPSNYQQPIVANKNYSFKTTAGGSIVN